MYDESYYIVKSKTDITNTLVFTKESQDNFLNELKSHIATYCNIYNTQSPLVTIKNEIRETLSNHAIVSNIRNSFLTLSQYENVLFVPSFKDSRHSSYWVSKSHNYIQTSNIGLHLTSIINKKFETSPNIYVAYPDSHVSLYKYIMEQYGVNIVSSNKMYNLGDDTYTVTPPEDVLFDAVYLGGVDNLSDGYFNATDIKADFSQYCSDNFDLIDDFIDDNKKIEFYTGDSPVNYENDNRLIGIEKSTSEISSYISTHFAPKALIESDTIHQDVSAVLKKVIDDGLKVY
jgi:hypothetical protein